MRVECLFRFVTKMGMLPIALSISTRPEQASSRGAQTVYVSELTAERVRERTGRMERSLVLEGIPFVCSDYCLTNRCA